MTCLQSARRAVSRVRRVDLVAPVLIGAVGALEITKAGAAHWPVGAVFLELTCVALALVRPFPVAVPLAIGVLYLIPALLGFDIAEPTSWVMPLPLAAFGAGRYAGPVQRMRSLAAAIAMMLIAVVTLEWLTSFDPNVVFGLAGTVGPWLFGVGIAVATARAEQAGAALERARFETAVERDSAVRGERERIAAELHDVLAHTLGEMVVRASVAKDNLAVDPRTAAAIIGGVATTGRAALVETGSLLRLLRDESDAVVAEQRMMCPPEPWSLTVGDIASPLVFVLLGLSEILVTDMPAPLLWIGGCLACAAVLILRRRNPCATAVVAAIVLAAPLVFGSADDYPAAWIVGFSIAGFSAGLRAPRWRGGAAVVVAWGIVLAGPAAKDVVAIGDVVLGGVFVLAPWLAGVVHARALARAREAGVAEERERLRAQRDAAAAVEDERRRIARELHDTLASSLSVMIVQASLAEELAQVDLERATVAAEALQTAGRRALEELGALLRRSADRLPQTAIEPRQGIADIATLAEEFRRTGVAVDVEIDAVSGGLPAGVELAAYRIVQEGLTNVLKHAPGSVAAVRLVCDGPAVAIEVRNGPAARTPVTAPSGHGLVGLRERVAHHGGALAATATRDGGFTLAARLPVVPEAA